MHVFISLLFVYKFQSTFSCRFRAFEHICFCQSVRLRVFNVYGIAAQQCGAADVRPKELHFDATDSSATGCDSTGSYIDEDLHQTSVNLY